MPLASRFRLPAISCAVAVLACELISRPFAEMGISDDLAYVVSAHTLATTGHIHYVGAAAAMLGAQLYLGAALIRLFGFSFSTVRMGTVLVAMAIAFLLQRSMVRAGIGERNAVIGTLALVLSPLYLILSATFMSDIYGLFAVVLCLYCCTRALQASGPNSTIGWLLVAVVTNAIFGTARQVAWLGILVMVPSTLWLLRNQRRVLFAGAAFVLAGAIFVFGCMAWFHRQPYSLPAPLGVGSFPLAHALGQFIHTFLDIPFLLLPLVALFLPEIRKSSRRGIAALSAVALVYLLLAIYWWHSHTDFLLEPTQHDWVSIYGSYGSSYMKGTPPIFLPLGPRLLLTIASVGGLLGLITALLRSRKPSSAAESATGVSWTQLTMLVAPFTLVYMLLLIPSATNSLFDRYTLELLVVFALCLVRFYQERIRSRLPLASILLTGAMAIYGVAATHNTFSFYRARLALSSEIRSAGVPDTSVDNGWEYNFGVELQHADHINDPGIVRPAHAYVPTPLPPTGNCSMNVFDRTPHIQPRYGISFDPNACYGPAPFAPVHYSRWLASEPGTLYVVNYLPRER